MGYAEPSKAFKILAKENHTVVVSRNNVFDKIANEL